VITFQFKSDLDPIAVYAAIVSTSSVLFAFVQWWRSGPRLTGKARGNMKLAPDDTGRTYINFSVYNRGTRRTKVTMIGLRTYPSWYAKIRGRPDWAAVLPKPLHVQLPATLEPGDYIVAVMPQDEEMVSKSQGMLFAEIYYTDHEKPFEMRIKPISKK
jgi:hypothetical protein